MTVKVPVNSLFCFNTKGCVNWSCRGSSSRIITLLSSPTPRAHLGRMFKSSSMPRLSYCLLLDKEGIHCYERELLAHGRWFRPARSICAQKSFKWQQFQDRRMSSAGNYQLMDEESTGRMVIPLRITSSLMRNLLEKGLFCLELPAHRWGIHPRNGILSGITSSWALIQTFKIKIQEKSSNR
jgi:hypothetical protein